MTQRRGERVYVALGSNVGDRAAHLAHARARLAPPPHTHLHAIEAERGRERRIRWGPRTLDLDIVRFGDRVARDPDLTLPHPELPNRPFWQREIAELGATAVPASPPPAPAR